jgi:hypothetical protein
MSTCRIWVKAFVLVAMVGFAAPVRAADVLGPNSDFPDTDLVMPFAATGSRSTFFSISNINANTLRLRWAFFDASGEKVDEVLRDILGVQGTDVVDITAISDRTVDGNGNFVNGPSRSLAGRNGFVIIYGDGSPSLLGNFTIANLTSKAGFGANAAGFGTIGALAPNQGLLGTTFSPSTLQDNLLVFIGLNGPPDLTSLTNANPPSGTVFKIQVTLFGNGSDPVVAQVERDVRGSALFTSLEDLFPGQDLGGSATIFASSDDANIIGYYGQAVGPFGAGQSLRTVALSSDSASSKTKAVKAVKE